jgi:hypothetical protein
MPGRFPPPINQHPIRRRLLARYSLQHVDNWVGTNSSGPDATYTYSEPNGYVYADGSAPGTVPLAVYSRQYSAGHTDWAAVASAEGLAWVEANKCVAGCGRGVAGRACVRACVHARAGVYI